VRVLDLYCGVGGASVGYHLAGYEVVGVDIEEQPDYPFPFLQADVLLSHPSFLRTFDLIHASPPCQAYIALTAGTNKGREYPRLTEPTRELLDRSGVPYVIENPAARPDVVLCGEMFGLAVIRHRRFELGNGFECEQPQHKPHRGRVAGFRHGQWYEGPYFAVYGEGGGKGTVAQWQGAMGIDWTNSRRSIAEAIPPAYTQYLGLNGSTR
jgi:hypothetical protein